MTSLVQFETVASGAPSLRATPVANLWCTWLPLVSIVTRCPSLRCRDLTCLSTGITLVQVRLQSWCGRLKLILRNGVTTVWDLWCVTKNESIVFVVVTSSTGVSTDSKTVVMLGRVRVKWMIRLPLRAMV